MRGLRIVLTIPQYRVKKSNRASWLEQVGNFTNDNQADLIVFPEGFLSRYFGRSNLREGQTNIAEISKKFNTAVLAGSSLSNGYEVVLYINPKARAGETHTHLQYKHVFSNRVAFELPDWAERVGHMLSPISLKGFKIGCLNCYEMFVPLLVDVLERNGPDIYIDLTGDNVPTVMWKSVVGGRSIECQAPFLCTMGYYRTWPGKAMSLAYDKGKEIQLQLPDGESSIESADPPTFSLVTLPTSRSGAEIQESYPKNWDDDLTVSMGTNKKADIEIAVTPYGYRISSYGRPVSTKRGVWSEFETENHRIALLSLSVKDLSNRSILLDTRPDEPQHKEPVKHVVLYYGESRGLLSDSELSTLAALRVLEHSIAVLIFAGDSRKVFRQSRVGTAIQVEERNGIFGIKAKGTNSLQGPSFPEQCAVFKTQYLNLLTRICP